jgi:hypothetical protein
VTLLIYAGIALVLVGLAGLLWFVQRVRRLQQAQADEAAIKAELRALVMLNAASVGLAFLGMALAVVGLILA